MQIIPWPRLRMQKAAETDGWSQALVGVERDHDSLPRHLKPGPFHHSHCGFTAASRLRFLGEARPSSTRTAAPDSRPDPLDSTTEAMVAVSKQLGVSRESVRLWVAQADIDADRREG